MVSTGTALNYRWFSYRRRSQWQPTPVLLPGKCHGQRSLVGYSPWGREESDMTEQLHFDFSLPCIGEGSGSPLQCSCLENPRDCRAWWAAVYGVAQSQTQLQRLSSSSSLVTDWRPCHRAEYTEWVHVPKKSIHMLTYTCTYTHITLSV